MAKKIRLTEHREALFRNKDAYDADYLSGRLYKTAVKHLQGCGYKVAEKRNKDIIKEFVDLIFESQNSKPYLYIDNELPLCWNQPKSWYKDGMDIIKYEWGHLKSRNDNGEKSNLNTHVDFSGWQFIEKGMSYNDIDENKPFVWFASFQDIKGSDNNGKIKEHNEYIHLIEWDCIILDEYHFGAWNETSKQVYDKDEIDDIKEQSEFTEDALMSNNFLYLSGTPFRALSNGEFLEDQIFNWTYTDEQNAKENWNDDKGENIYKSLPKMVIMTYKIPEEIRNIALQGETNEFDLNLFFKAKKINYEYIFEHETYVQKWLDLMRGYNIENIKYKKPPLPFEDIRLLNNLLHSFWFLPGINACYAMADLLKKERNVFYHDYEIIIAAGTKAGIGKKAADRAKNR